MPENDLKGQIKEMMVERCFLSIDPQDIGDQDNLMRKVGLDSVQILEVVVGLEDIFGLTFDDADFEIENFKNVSAIAEYVEKKQQVK